MLRNDLTPWFKKIELFKNLTEEELKVLIKYIHKKRMDSGQILINRNEISQGIYIILEGEVGIFERATSNKNKPIAILKSNDFFENEALAACFKSFNFAKCLRETTFFTINNDDLLSIFKSKPYLASKLLFTLFLKICGQPSQNENISEEPIRNKRSDLKRMEQDPLGREDISNECYYGIQTKRALENFKITGKTLSDYTELVASLVMLKMASAKANQELGLLPKSKAKAVIHACQEILKGEYHNHFVLDMIQGGAGTSINMNANEVITNRALEILGYPKGSYKYLNPNSDVNLSQSTNDVFPSALKLAIIRKNQNLMKALETLIQSLKLKAKKFEHIIKIGRTQLQDAVPMTLGQEFMAFAITLSEDVKRLRENSYLLLEINIGGTAIGTEINTKQGYKERVIEYLREISGIQVVLAPNLIEATQDTGAFVMYSSVLKRLAIKLSKMCNDIRLLASGPRAGFNEIRLEKMQPGSSIMPGKINPVIPEVVNQISYRVIGNDLTVTLASEAGQLQLNAMLPVIAFGIFESMEILERGILTLKERCIEGIEANEARCRELVMKSIGLVTALNPELGYEVCSKLAEKALNENRNIYEVVLEEGILPRGKLDHLLCPENMIRGCGKGRQKNS